MSDDPKKRDEDERVTEAYENISKKIENLRKDDDPEDSDDPLDNEDNDVQEDEEEPVKQQEDDSLEDEEEPADEEEQEDEAEQRPIPRPMPEPEPSTLDDLTKPTYEDDTNIPRLRNQPQAQNPTFHTASSSVFNDPQDYQSRFVNSKPKSSPKWHLLILILIGLAVIGGTVYLLKNQFGDSGSSEASPSPSISVFVSSPSPSPTAEPLDRSKFKVRVLNGTTKAGLAASVSGKLKDLGYQTDKTGNAPKQDYKSTEIKVKTSATGLGEQLIKDLSSDFTASVSGQLKDTDAADAEVILGQ